MVGNEAAGMGHGWGFLLLRSDCYHVKCIRRDRPEEGDWRGAGSVEKKEDIKFNVVFIFI